MVVEQSDDTGSAKKASKRNLVLVQSFNTNPHLYRFERAIRPYDGEQLTLENLPFTELAQNWNPVCCVTFGDVFKEYLHEKQRMGYID